MDNIAYLTRIFFFQLLPNIRYQILAHDFPNFLLYIGKISKNAYAIAHMEYKKKSLA